MTLKILMMFVCFNKFEKLAFFLEVQDLCYEAVHMMMSFVAYARANAQRPSRSKSSNSGTRNTHDVCVLSSNHKTREFFSLRENSNKSCA